MGSTRRSLGVDVLLNGGDTAAPNRDVGHTIDALTRSMTRPPVMIES